MNNAGKVTIQSTETDVTRFWEWLVIFLVDQFRIIEVEHTLIELLRSSK